MKNNIKYGVLIIFFFGIKNSLMASSEKFFFISEEFNFIAQKVHLFQEEEKTPLEGKIYFSSPNGLLEFKYVLDTLDKGDIFDTPITQFSTKKELWEDVLQYYISQIKELTKKKIDPLISLNKEMEDSKNNKAGKNLYYPLKINNKAILNRKTNQIFREPICFNPSENVLFLKHIQECIKKAKKENSEENKKVVNPTNTPLYPYFISLEKTYRRDNVGMVKFYLSHENKIIPKNVQKLESLEKAFLFISNWFPHDLKLKIDKYNQKLLKNLYI